jgi:predicted ATPase
MWRELIWKKKLYHEGTNMLKKLTIKNFKAIQDMTIEFTPLTVLIGDNGCGKSTILQALDFLQSATFRDIPEYLRERGWTFSELKSQCNGSKDKPIQFISEWTFIIHHSVEQLVWSLSVDYKEKWMLQEQLVRKSDGISILSYHIDGFKDNPVSLGGLNIQSSALKYVAGTSINTDEIDLLSVFLSISSNYELLSPEKMRSGSKDPNYSHLICDIGINGGELAQCIENMNQAQKQDLNKTLSEMTGRDFSVKTVDLGNRVEMILVENTEHSVITTNSSHISDGLLRLLAFCIISQNFDSPCIGSDNRYIPDDEGHLVDGFKKSAVKCGMILFDEIEDGINPYLTQKIIDLLRSIEQNQGRQVIVTTHSPVILNDFEPEEIVFLWKYKNGSVHSKAMFSTEEMQRTLKVLNPGEVWANYEKNEIIQRLNPDNEKAVTTK